MAKGTVKWFNTTKGYGFIEPEDGSKDAFVHISAVERAGMNSLREGQKVSYELQEGRNGKSSAEDLVALEIGEEPDRGQHGDMGARAGDVFAKHPPIERQRVVERL